ncbi:MAG: acetate kinase [Alphaproteobacteria bacterium]|nr:acetate kinase [Alphaproteobacteria bacterium]
MDKILVLNSGSTSVKFQLFLMDSNTHNVISKGLVDRIGLQGSKLIVKTDDAHDFTLETPIKDHKDAIKVVLDYLLQKHLKNTDELSAVGHRMGHGGEYFDKSVIIDEDVMEKIYDTIPLIPLHGPAFVHGVEAVTSLLPNKMQVATFDSAFHQSMDKSAYLYAIPKEYYKDLRIRRYGFHGTSHNYISHKTEEILGFKGKIISCHLGGGGSICAINNGKSVDTTMGYTPSAGLIMSTRSGDMDPYIPLHIMKTQNKTADEVNQMFNKQSGMFGLTNGHSDMRDIIESAEKGDKDCEFAIEAYVYSLVKTIGAYVAVMGGIDALVFTAGIGENSPLIRQKVCEKLSYLGINLDLDKNNQRPCAEEITTSNSSTKVFVIPANEELMIAEESYELLEMEKQKQKEAV